MDDYIVRIKRREHPDAGDIIGLVEVVETQTCHPFHSFEELRRILADCPTPPSGTENKESIKQEPHIIRRLWQKMVMALKHPVLCGVTVHNKKSDRGVCKIFCYSLPARARDLSPSSTVGVDKRKARVRKLTKINKGESQ